MNMIKNKLNSQKGASITWALLIFMVCAVVGSAVLVAGTTASGRMSKLTENDQRYYAVTSTSAFLRDVLAKKVTVVRTANMSDPDSPEYTIVYSTASDYEPGDNTVKKLVMDLMQWHSDVVTTNSDETVVITPYTTPSASEFWNKDTIDFGDSDSPTITLALSETETTGDMSTAIATVSPFQFDKDNGSVTITVSKNNYAMQLDFMLERSVNISQTDDMITKTDEFQWILKEARKMESVAEPLSH